MWKAWCANGGHKAVVLATESKLDQEHLFCQVRTWASQTRTDSPLYCRISRAHVTWAVLHTARLPATAADTALPLLLLEARAVSRAVIFKMKKCWKPCIILKQVKSSRKSLTFKWWKRIRLSLSGSSENKLFKWNYRNFRSMIYMLVTKRYFFSYDIIAIIRKPLLSFCYNLASFSAHFFIFPH